MKGTSSLLHSSGGSIELWDWTFIHWRSLVFQIVGRSHWWSLYGRKLGKLSVSLLLVFFLWLVKSWKLKTPNNIDDHLKKSGLYSNFQYGFGSSRSTADHLIVVSDRIARAFNRSIVCWGVSSPLKKASSC